MTKHARLTTTANYDEDLATARDILAPDLADATGEDEFLAEQLPGSLADALNNSWVEGVRVDEWAEKTGLTFFRNNP